jgi:putative membrane protein
LKGDAEGLLGVVIAAVALETAVTLVVCVSRVRMKRVPHVPPRCSSSWTAAFAVGVALVVAGCSRTAPSNPRGPAPLDDGQIAEVIDAIDTQQIETAHLGVEHASDPEVRAFAQELLGDQRAARKELLARVAVDRVGLVPSILVDLFESRERAARAWLSNLTGQTFDQDFVANEIKEQTRQLDWLDHMLIPGAHDADLRAELQRQRPLAAARLATAQRLAGRFPRSASDPQP